MDSQDNNKHGEGCHGCKDCDRMCVHGSCHRGIWYCVLRWALALIAIGIVFHVGMKIGELKGVLESGYGQHYYDQSYDQGGCMDNGYGNSGY